MGVGESLSLGSAPVLGFTAAAGRALGWGGRGARVRPTSGQGREADAGQETPKNMLNFPKPTARQPFGKFSMTVVLNFPNPEPVIRFGKLSRF